ncbi:DJ-1/PfpI family protein [Pedobacter sp. SYSU D00535]|uniref:DJ-1/PfpI family protein n=1 Tax=Pedobacter sp. SYSU D00535 TaxID=2810308 RepID=UPI001A96E27F|nr:DJ-1/PfpI family protein [Pedobacter sp. SYSU D00535]
MKTAVIIIFDDFTDIDVFLPWDLLNRVKAFVPDFTVKIIGTGSVHTSSTGIDLATHASIELCSTADLVVVASGKGTRTLIKDNEFLSRIHLDPDRQVICSLCTGSLILAALGHLKGLSATTYPTAFDLLRSYEVDVIENESLVIQGNIATAAECLAAIELMSWAIGKLFGEDISSNVLATVTPNGKTISV